MNIEQRILNNEISKAPLGVWGRGILSNEVNAIAFMTSTLDIQHSLFDILNADFLTFNK